MVNGHGRRDVVLDGLLYRIDDQGRIVHAVQRGGDLFEVEGDIFDGYEAGAPIPGGLASVRVLAPVCRAKSWRSA